VRKYIKSGDLKYSCYNPTPAKSKQAYGNNLPLSPLGQGYWFTKKEVLRWKDWMDKRMSAANRWSNHEARKGASPGLSTTSNPISGSDPKSQVVEFNASSFEDVEEYSDQELALTVLKAGEKAIYKTLMSMPNAAPYDLYYLINSLQYAKKEWRKHDSPDKGEYSLKILRRAEEMLLVMLDSDVAFKPYDLNHMLRTEEMIQEERRRILKGEVGQTGISSDEILEEAAD